MDSYNSTIVFFDSHCLLCNGSVRFILRHEKQQELFFAPIGGLVFRKVTKDLVQDEIPDSIVVAHNNAVFYHSKAILIILICMGGYWKVLGKLAKIVPTPIFDFFYKILIHNRYRWFGTTDSCILPTTETRQRFLD